MGFGNCYMFTCLLIVTANLLTNGSTLTRISEASGSCCHPPLHGNSSKTVEEKSDVRKPNSDENDSLPRWLQDILQTEVFLKFRNLPEVLSKFRSMPTINQALLNSLLTLTNVLPPEEDVFEQLLSRKNFVADESGASLLLTAFTQHVLLQFASESDPVLVFDVSQIYGSTSKEELLLRTGVGGKLKMTANFPASLSEAPVNMLYPPAGERTLRYFTLTGEPQPNMTRWAMGNSLLGASPLAFSVGVLWLREHNRLCDRLIGRHPNWSDQRLFDAARAIVTGKMIMITLRELLPRMAGRDLLSFETAFPDELTDENIRLLPKTTHLVTGLLWTWQLPCNLTFAATDYPLSDILFTDHRLVFDNGLAATFEAFSSQPAGKATANNHVHALKGWTKKLLRQLRRQKTISFNKYREIAGMPVIRSFFQLTGNNRSAEQLRILYGDEDALELYPGLVVEKLEGRAVLPPTLLDLVSSWFHAAISWSSLGPPTTWDTNPDMFGDGDGLAEVKKATIISLLKENSCGGRRASLDVPRPGDLIFPQTAPSCSFSFELGRLSTSLVCLLSKNRDVGFSFEANILTAS